MGALSWLDPERHEGWPLARALFAAAALLTWLPRGAYVEEVYSSAGVVLASGRFPLTEHVIFSPLTAWIVYGAVILSLIAVLAGRLTRASLIVFLVASWLLLEHECLNIKAYDRLITWQALMLLLAPAGAARVKEGNPAARYAMILVYIGLYGSTGWNKIVDDPSWWKGVPLAYDFLDRNFGGKALGAWLSVRLYLVAPMATLTLIFEAGFPVLFFIRRLRPWLLALGASFHMAAMLTLHVNTFSWIAVAAYPVLLTPQQYAAARDWVLARLRPGKLRAA